MEQQEHPGYLPKVEDNDDSTLRYHLYCLQNIGKPTQTELFTLQS